MSQHEYLLISPATLCTKKLVYFTGKEKEMMLMLDTSKYAVFRDGDIHASYHFYVFEHFSFSK
jgi:hypothetical protein